MLGDQRLVAGLDDDQLEPEALRVGEPQAPVTGARHDASPRSRSSQKSSASSDATRKRIGCTIPRPAGRGARPGTRRR